MTRSTSHRLPNRVAALALVAASLPVTAYLAQAPAAQPPVRPTFRADVEAVQLDLRVVDRDDTFIKDLRKDEFRVFEDGVEQSVSNFSLVDIPVEPAPIMGLDGPRADPDVATNGQPNGRLYVIVLDDMSGTQAGGSVARALAKQFIELNLTDVDRAALVTTSGRRDMAQDFTNNRRRLLDAAERYQGGYGQEPSTLKTPGMSFAQPGGEAVSDKLHSTMLTLTALAKWMAQIDGRRKGIVLISETLGRSISPGKDLSNSIDLTLAAAESSDIRDFVQAAARGNVSLYTVDPIGVPTGPGKGIRPIGRDIDDNSAFDHGRQQSLITLAEATGGFAVTQTNDFTGGYNRIVTENSSYYVLGYVSSNPRKDGKYRSIEVRTTRPGLKVHARLGYVAPRDAKSAESTTTPGLPKALNDMLGNPLSVSGLPLTIAAPVFRGPSSSKAAAVIVVEASGQRLLLTNAGGRANGGLTLAIAAADASGKTQAFERGQLSMRLSQDTRAAVAERGARLVTQLQVAPGKYLLKVAAVDTSDGTTKGSVLLDLDVPDFSKAPLSMSGIALSSITEAPVPTVARDPKLKQTLGEFPTARRSFTRFEELRLYAEIYDAGKRGPRPVTVKTSITNAAGGLVFRREATSTTSADPDKVLTHRVVTTVPLNDLAKGTYVLGVEASAAGSPAISRQIPFSIR